MHNRVFALLEIGYAVLGVAGVVVMAIGAFHGDAALLGLVLLAVGLSGFFLARWLRGECDFRTPR